jgi:hypothetical protein
MQRVSGKSVCVHADTSYWKSTDMTFPDSGGNCSDFSLSRDFQDPGSGRFYPLTLALEFHPIMSECTSPVSGVALECSTANYIAVEANPASGDITVLRATNSGHAITPDEQKRIEAEIDAENKKSQEQGKQLIANMVESAKQYQEDAEKRQLIAQHTRNRQLVHELAQFSPAWATGQAAYVRGTVSRVEPSPDGRQKPARLYFQDTDGFDVCIPPQFIRDPERYVGQRVEIRGRIIRQECGDLPAGMQVVLPTAIFELAKGEPPDEAILPGMDPAIPLGTPLPSHTDAEYRQMAINRPMNGRPSASAGPAPSVSITPGTRIFVTLLQAIHLDFAAENSTYQALIEQPINLADGTTFPPGGLAILKFWRTAVPGQAPTLNLAVQSIGIRGGQQIPIATSPAPEVAQAANDGRKPWALRPQLHLSFTVTTPSPNTATAPPIPGTPR